MWQWPKSQSRVQFSRFRSPVASNSADKPQRCSGIQSEEWSRELQHVLLPILGFAGNIQTGKPGNIEQINENNLRNGVELFLVACRVRPLGKLTWTRTLPFNKQRQETHKVLVKHRHKAPLMPRLDPACQPSEGDRDVQRFDLLAGHCCGANEKSVGRLHGKH